MIFIVSFSKESGDPDRSGLISICPATRAEQLGKGHANDNRYAVVRDRTCRGTASIYTIHETGDTDEANYGISKLELGRPDFVGVLSCFVLARFDGTLGCLASGFNRGTIHGPMIDRHA